ncbi:S46 family peptidase [Candidatus Phycosocius spiralis]|uniref:Dipeptidyl-peptidase n=1 Tax=Candidatus Phycosocius spiralis TaxID=2815099 RepID=A0ABQ4PWE4_9PROT|nr:S46 family peptidase [Candidatus Phycosocius spiralis]GIU67376.1 dipeptidyl-peptidase [Candidatus Phycosocius spiralis]
MNSKFLLAASLSALLLSSGARADEGMWTFDAFPAAKMKSTYGFAPDQAWLTKVQQSAVRLSVGCSASLVSDTGLILTNWHCASSCVADLSSAERDYGLKGFLAATLTDEKVCPGMEAEVLVSITDKTAQVKAATKGVEASKVAQIRSVAITKLEEEACKDADKDLFRCDMISLFRGGQYKLYKYRIYKDVRLVFSPENVMGFFGGDPDNFNFPRYNLDSAFLRAYENGKPVSTPTHLTWTTETPKDGEVVFVAGNPGSTERLRTTSQLKFERDYRLLTRQLVRSELRGRLIEYRTKNDEAKRSAEETLFGVENSFKAQYGQQRALMDPHFFAIKEKEEANLKAKVRANPKLLATIGDPWAEIDAALTKQQDLFLEHEFLEARAGSISGLYGAARQLVRIANERAKPLAERLPGFSDAAIGQTEKQLLTETPIYKDMEVIGLELWLSKAREYLTADNPSIKRLLGAESPEGLAARAIAGTKLTDKAAREALIKGGKAAIDASTDPLIVLARRAETDARAINVKMNQEVNGPISQAAEKIAKARFAIYGTNVYPDATFTLRLSYGVVKGWNYAGVTVPATTTIGGYFERASGEFPYVAAPSWLAAKSSLDQSTPFNIVSTNDIIGGNSGSPLIDKQGRVVGAVFDGNIHSLGGNYAYDGRLNRTVSVTTASITEALRKIYKADRLVAELKSK